jgi:hypothetical protein
MSYSSRSFALLLFALAALAAAPAEAEPSVCTFDDTGTRTCLAPRACAGRDDCVTGGPHDDWFCEATPPMAGMECMPGCTTMFGCGIPSDCPAINGMAPTCDPVQPPSGSSMTPNACTYRLPSGMTIAPDQLITYCTAPGFHIPLTRLSACHTIPGTSIVTTDYYLGDCDGDGCPNGHDTDPCVAAAGRCAVADGADSPFCPVAPPLACELSAAGPSCTDARPCSTDTGALPCEGTALCEDGWSDVPRCRPSCSTLFLCRVPTAMARPPEPCPRWNGEAGTCVSSSASIAAGYDGLCVYPSFADASCASMIPSPSACFSDMGVATANFFAGDCDGDGIANACDALRCDPSGRVADGCFTPPGAGCAVAPPPPDAGVPDAGGLDAGVLDGSVVGDGGNAGDTGVPSDAGNSQSDGGNTQSDGGNTQSDGSASMDASAGNDAALGVGFQGGGGCRCEAVGTRTRAPLALWLLAPLAVWLSRRRRR